MADTVVQFCCERAACYLHHGHGEYTIAFIVKFQSLKSIKMGELWKNAQGDPFVSEGPVFIMRLCPGEIFSWVGKK